MKEPVVTVKMSYSELQLLNKMIDAHIFDLDEMYQDTGEGEEVSPAKLTLQNQLLKIEEWIDEEKHKAIIDKRTSEESIKEQTKVETHQRPCVLCDT
tara:strand:+ start:765 stop:1055 length:291 start_codon:yes stop_codon:yes gene_type:complete